MKHLLWEIFCKGWSQHEPTELNDITVFWYNPVHCLNSPRTPPSVGISSRAILYFCTLNWAWQTWTRYAGGCSQGRPSPWRIPKKNDDGLFVSLQRTECWKKRIETPCTIALQIQLWTQWPMESLFGRFVSMSGSLKQNCAGSGVRYGLVDVAIIELVVAMHDCRACMASWFGSNSNTLPMRVRSSDLDLPMSVRSKKSDPSKNLALLSTVADGNDLQCGLTIYLLKHGPYRFSQVKIMQTCKQGCEWHGGPHNRIPLITKLSRCHGGCYGNYGFPLFFPLTAACLHGTVCIYLVFFVWYRRVPVFGPFSMSGCCPVVPAICYCIHSCAGQNLIWLNLLPKSLPSDRWYSRNSCGLHFWYFCVVGKVWLGRNCSSFQMTRGLQTRGSRLRSIGPRSPWPLRRVRSGSVEMCFWMTCRRKCW